MELEEWVPPSRLAEWTMEATESLLATVQDFDDDDDARWRCDYKVMVNPAIWEIAHAAWFAEWFVLRQLHGHKPLMEGVDARYDSAKVPHTTRWQLDFPTPERTRQYVRDVGEALAELAMDSRGLDSTAYFTLYAIMHHDAHTEALTYTRQTLDWAPYPELPKPGPVNADPIDSGDAAVAGGRLLLGGSRHQPFVMDNDTLAAF